MRRNQILGTVGVAALAAGGLVWMGAGSTASASGITVYKSASCGCCNDWIAHLEANGFVVEARNTEDMGRVKQRFGVDYGLASCHTAVVNGYVVEGHVPAADIRRLLAERPAVIGLAVPGMPVGSPGMEQGDYRQPYSVLSFDGEGNTEVFADYR